MEINKIIVIATKQVQGVNLIHLIKIPNLKKINKNKIQKKKFKKKKLKNYHQRHYMYKII